MLDTITMATYIQYQDIEKFDDNSVRSRQAVMTQEVRRVTDDVQGVIFAIMW